MGTSLVQKIELSLVFFVINVLWFFDDIWYYLKKGILNTIRIFFCLVVIGYFFKGFYLQPMLGDFSSYTYVLNPNTQSVLGAATNLTEFPFLKNSVPNPVVTAKAIYVEDITHGKELFSKNKDEKLAPASTTKLMAAIVSLELYKLDEIIAIPKACTEIEGQKGGFLEGEKYTVHDLLASMIINSSADAACALSVGKIGYFEFINKMNEKAEEIGLESTSFSNPIGLDDLGGVQFSTAKNLYKLALEARKETILKEFVRTTEKQIKSLDGKESLAVNTNRLLWEVPGTVGIKTGKTEAAGEVLIYEYNKDGKNFIIVVMGSEDRFTDTKNILNWVLESYSWN
uniref:D-alanyl-D-alanine carboxypeptidase n=1 Tax=candidate division WWE3 bacterium TaxID=2053526 RepID=A0A7C4XT16_UNCKA